MPHHAAHGPLSFTSGVADPTEQRAQPSATGGKTVFTLSVSKQVGEAASEAPSNKFALHSCKGIPDGAALHVDGEGDACVMAKFDPTIADPDTVQLHEVQLHNLHLCTGEKYKFEQWEGDDSGSPASLVDLTAEVRPLRFSAEPLHVDARALSQRLMKSLFRSVVAVNEVLTMVLTEDESVDGCGQTVAVRVSEANNVDVAERMAMVRYHCFRGTITADTVVYLEAVRNANKDNVDDLVLHNAVCRNQSPTLNMIHVDTSDGEYFEVHRNILRPCIALTQAVQDSAKESARDCMVKVTVDVECLTFDRVLIYLEKEAVGDADSFQFDLNLTEQLLFAAQRLGCRGLEERCQQRMGAFESRIRTYRWQEVCDHCEQGDKWIVVDGMVLDVTR